MKSQSTEEDPMYGVAMLKLAMELKKSKKTDLDEILPGVLGKMKIGEREFRQYLAKHRPLTLALSRKNKG